MPLGAVVFPREDKSEVDFSFRVARARARFNYTTLCARARARAMCIYDDSLDVIKMA